MFRFWRRSKTRPVASPPADAPTVAHDAWTAIQVLEEHGWAQGKFRNDKGAYCAIGAARVAILETHRLESSLILSLSGLPRYQRLTEELYTICGHTLRSNCPRGWEGRIEGFNDATGRTKAEVIALFEQVIENNRPPSAPVAVGKQDDHELAGGPSV